MFGAGVVGSVCRVRARRRSFRLRPGSNWMGWRLPGRGEVAAVGWIPAFAGMTGRGGRTPEGARGGHAGWAAGEMRGWSACADHDGWGGGDARRPAVAGAAETPGGRRWLGRRRRQAAGGGWGGGGARRPAVAGAGGVARRPAGGWGGRRGQAAGGGAGGRSPGTGHAASSAGGAGRHGPVARGRAPVGVGTDRWRGVRGRWRGGICSGRSLCRVGGRGRRGRRTRR